MAVIGNNIILYKRNTSVDPYEDIPFACSTNCTFSVNVDQKEVTSQSSAWFREYKNDVATWQVTCDGLVTLNNQYNYLALLDLQLDRTPIVIDFAVDNGVDGLVVISGTCNLTNLQLNAPYKDVATYSVTLQGSGAYGVAGTQITPGGIIIREGQVYNKQYTATGGETTITWADMIGKECLYVSRGGIDVRDIITSGIPSSEQVKFNTLTGVVTFGRALEADEFIRGLFN
jgi:predicted secreted protein